MHDDEYLESERQRLINETDMGSYAILSCQIVAQKYHQHMMSKIVNPEEMLLLIQSVCKKSGVSLVINGEGWDFVEDSIFSQSITPDTDMRTLIDRATRAEALHDIGESIK